MIRFEEILPGIHLLRMPFGIVWTGVILIRGKKNILIDSGCCEPEEYLLPALKAEGLDIADVSWLVNTHCHGDHISAHYTLVNRYGVKTAAYSGGARRLEDPAANAVRIRTAFPEFSPAPQSWLKGVKADRLLEDGEILEDRLKVIHTPGHDEDCVCWLDLESATLFTGDSLQANGTPTQGIGFYQDLAGYRYTLKRLAEEDIRNIVCGHTYDGIGDVIRGRENVKQALKICGEYVEKYAQAIREETLAGVKKPDEIACRLIERMGCGMPEYLFMPVFTVTQHLAEMEK